jgi:hypothetical protein
MPRTSAQLECAALNNKMREKLIDLLFGCVFILSEWTYIQALEDGSLLLAQIIPLKIHATVYPTLIQRYFLSGSSTYDTLYVTVTCSIIILFLPLKNRLWYFLIFSISLLLLVSAQYISAFVLLHENWGSMIQQHGHL